jgi:hypothetical protein
MVFADAGNAVNVAAMMERGAGEEVDSELYFLLTFVLPAV